MLPEGQRRTKFQLSETLTIIIFIIINRRMKLKTNLRTPKRGDLMDEEIKRWVADGKFAPGDKLPKEQELQTLFGVSKGTAREALKSLEVQGLVTLSTGPTGGATIGAVPFDRAFQLVQNYLFFRDVDVAQI